MRPRRLIVVAGTGTEIGKTYVAARVASTLRDQGKSVLARKPAQSFAPDDPSTDADVLADATGETPEEVCPSHRWYPVPMAPPMAAVALGRPSFSTKDLAGEVSASWRDADVCLVETAGGMWSPQAFDGRHAGDLAADLDADGVLLVADAALGVINAVRGAAAALDRSRPLVVALNRFDADDGLHRENLAWLVQHDGFVVATSPAEAANLIVAL